MTPLARTRVLLACSFLLLALTSCSRGSAPVPVSQVWVAGHAQPAFDPDGPPDALRWTTGTGNRIPSTAVTNLSSTAIPTTGGVRQSEAAVTQFWY